MCIEDVKHHKLKQCNHTFLRLGLHCSKWGSSNKIMLSFSILFVCTRFPYNVVTTCSLLLPLLDVIAYRAQNNPCCVNGSFDATLHCLLPMILLITLLTNVMMTYWKHLRLTHWAALLCCSLGRNPPAAERHIQYIVYSMLQISDSLTLLSVEWELVCQPHNVDTFDWRADTAYSGLHGD